jgi:hypothetical protein
MKQSITWTRGPNGEWVRWHHFEIYRPATTRLFVDGVEVKTPCSHTNQRQGERGPAYCADCGEEIT